MWELSRSFPRQLQEGLKAVPRHNFAERPGPPLALVGMGGSGIAGELLASLAARVGESPVLPVRDFALPAWVRPPASAVLVSYSGGTAETLAAYDEAGRRGVPRAVLASGGELIERAKRDQVLHVQVPAGQPPRASLGYLFGGLAGLLRHAVPSVARDLPREASSLEARAGEFSSPEGAPAALARGWAGHGDLWVYAPDALAAVARRWKSQVEENTKRVSHFDVYPELQHNAVVGWSGTPREAAAEHYVVVLRGQGGGEAMSRRCDYLVNYLRDRGARVAEATSVARGDLGELLDLVWQGDYLSLWAARELGVDPLPVKIIEEMKAALSSAPGARSRSR